jgi:hypothetical protein
MHKFPDRRAVADHLPRAIDALRATGEYEYRNLAEAHERMARESQLEIMIETDVQRAKGKRP